MDKQQILSEVKFKAVRSSGAGGQNVNKVSSKVVLNFDVENSNGLSEEEKLLVLSKLSPRLTKENILILNCDEDRSQFKNKAIVIKRFFDLITQSLHIEKIRKATKIPKSVIRKRLKDKKTVSEVKKNRRRPEF
jgi:ribosome-associated protein